MKKKKRGGGEKSEFTKERHFPRVFTKKKKNVSLPLVETHRKHLFFFSLFKHCFVLSNDKRTKREKNSKKKKSNVNTSSQTGNEEEEKKKKQ